MGPSSPVAPEGVATIAILEDPAAEAWQSCHGIERQLIDVIAKAQASSFTWMQYLTTNTSMQSAHGESMQREEG
jgi:hypothetical protein